MSQGEHLALRRDEDRFALMTEGVCIDNRPACGATLILERVDAETASQQLGHSSPTITREFYISKPAIAADVAHVLEELARPDDD